jgi:hypothetical protein
MREVTLRVEDPSIRINGQVFTLRLNDLTLYTRVQALLEKCAGLAAGATTAETALAVAGEANAILNDALGDGAGNSISGGRPVSLSLMLEWLSLLAQEAAGHYAREALREDDAPGEEGAALEP